MSKKNNIYVIGHKNPDTDSICSAISYAYLKNELSQKQEEECKYIPTRAGHINEETQYVLRYFEQEAPLFVNDIRPQVTDIEIRKTEGVDAGLSLKKAWDIMRGARIVSLPIIEEGKLAGIITVSDIAYSDMDVYDNMILSKAGTNYKNIVETIDGEMIVGDLEGEFEEGHVLIAAANPDMMEGYIEPQDMVILGNRYESQLCAIEMDAQCIVVCMGATVSKTIRKMAKEHGCRIIVSPYDTYTVARLINHSMPVRYFMTTENLITFHTTDYVDDIQETMAKRRFRDFPITDNQGNYVGMISRRNLLDLDRKKLILVDHNEKAQAVDGFEEAEILEIIDHHRLGNIETNSPVYFRNQPVGCTATIITQMYMENGIEIPEKIAGLLCSAILSDTLMFRSPTCTAIDRIIAEKLAAIAHIEIEKYAADKLKDSFVFLLIKLDNLKYVNDKGGREAGDALLKVFGKVLKRAASSYGFVGYNGSDQFIGMFEECTVQRAEDFKQYLEELVHYHNVQTPNVTMQVSVAVSETNSEQIYDIRKLMGATFRKASAQQPRREAENKSEDKKEENKDNK